MVILKIKYIILIFILLIGCSSIPVNTSNSCSIFDERYLWYKHTKASYERWGAPIPGSLIGYLIYGNLALQPNWFQNPFGISINHLLFFSYITVLAIFVRSRIKSIFTSNHFILSMSLILEILHLIVPNRAFEFYDLIANFTGVVIILLLNSFIKWRKYL